MRFCLPRTSTLRGAGLGNELFAWSKAFLASQVLDAKILHPAFGLNRRQYYRDFGTSRFDWLGQRVLTTSLPVVEFGEAAYWSTGKPDFEEAVAVFAEQQGLFRRENYVFAVNGMWGGFLAIRKARTFVMAELMRARNAVGNLHAILGSIEQDKLVIAVHIRGGDFRAASDETDYRGRFNVALPIDWYVSTCESLEAAFPGRIRFVLVTDASDGSVKPFVDRFNPLTTSHLQNTTPSDLLVMGMADSIVCSVSTFSMWGAFLSDGPYFWFAPHLQSHGEHGSLWGNESAEQNNGPTASNLRRVINGTKGDGTIARGIPIGFGDTIPESAIEVLEARLRTRALSKDLIYSGVAPVPSSGPNKVT